MGTSFSDMMRQLSSSDTPKRFIPGTSRDYAQLMDNQDYMPGDWTSSYYPSGSDTYYDEELSPYKPTFQSGGLSLGSGDSIASSKRRYTEPGNEYSYPIESGSIMNSGPSSSRSSSVIRYVTDPMPTLASYDKYVMPERDAAREKQLIQEAAAPGVRALRSSVNKAIMSNEDNPNARRMTVRSALEGFGTGLENVMAGARKEGRTQYNSEYSDKVKEYDVNYQNDVNQKNMAYEAALRNYLRKWASITPSKRG